MRVLTDLDPDSFSQYWLNAVEAAQPPETVERQG